MFYTYCFIRVSFACFQRLISGYAQVVHWSIDFWFLPGAWMCGFDAFFTTSIQYGVFSRYQCTYSYISSLCRGVFFAHFSRYKIHFGWIYVWSRLWYGCGWSSLPSSCLGNTCRKNLGWIHCIFGRLSIWKEVTCHCNAFKKTRWRCYKT